jgi:hypothetical protein
MRTNELVGEALDWAVAKCEGHDIDDPTWWVDFGTESCYSTDWAQGGPIIEREGIDIYQSGVWVAEMDGKHTTEGPTPLIAAMRCYVAYKLGDTVDALKGASC